MEMEMEVVETLQASDAVAERLLAAAEALEAAVERLAGLSVEASRDGLAERLAAGLRLRSVAEGWRGGRRLRRGRWWRRRVRRRRAVAWMRRWGALSVEQRIAVKAGLMRAGLV